MANANPWEKLLEITSKWEPIAEVIKKAESERSAKIATDSANNGSSKRTTTHKESKSNVQ